jgi:hypothetical protein
MIQKFDQAQGNFSHLLSATISVLDGIKNTCDYIRSTLVLQSFCEARYLVCCLPNFLC